MAVKESTHPDFSKRPDFQRSYIHLVTLLILPCDPHFGGYDGSADTVAELSV